jgi:23S rRNA pseudouridine1911/1915/1917 synthase
VSVRIGPDLAGRLDAVVRRLAPGLSRRLVRTLIADGAVRVNGRPARKGARVAPGDVVELPALAGIAADPDVGLRVLHEDADLIAIDKPGGVRGHALDPRQRGTIAGALVARDPTQATIGDPLSGGLVHRLDIGTSGVLLAARTPASWDALRAAFRRHDVTKRYIAIVSGAPAAGAVVDAPLAHDTQDRRRMRVARPGERAWPASTHVCDVVASGARATVTVEIRSGVTHQVRAHLAWLGHPVVGDVLYGGEAGVLAVGRHALHAATLEIAARALRVTAPLPADMRALV